MSVITNAKKHFKTKLTDTLESIDVPEWESKVYFKGSATLKQTEEIVALHRENKVAEALAQTLCASASATLFSQCNATISSVCFRVALPLK